MKKRILEEDIIGLGKEQRRKLRKLKELEIGDFVLYDGEQGALCISYIQKIQNPYFVDDIINGCIERDGLKEYSIRVGSYTFECRKEELTPLFTIGDILEIIENLGLKWEKTIIQGESKLLVYGDINPSKYDLVLKQKFQERFYKEYTLTPSFCIVLYKVIEEIIELLR